MWSIRPKLGVALGGGTARGFAHVGALKALEERGLFPDAIAGSSFGAVIAALYALGMSGVALEHLVRQQNNLEIWAQGIDFGLHRGALINGTKLSAWLDRKFFSGPKFEDTEIPLAVGCTDIESGELVVINEGSIAEAIRASCALPLFFSAVCWKNHFLTDGGFVEPVPYRALALLKPEKMVGIHVGVNTELSTVVRIVSQLSQSKFGQAFHRVVRALPIQWPLSQQLEGASVAARSFSNKIDPPPGVHLVSVDPPISWLQFHRSPLAIEAGEAAVFENTPDLARKKTLQQA